MSEFDAICFEANAPYGTFRIPSSSRGYMTYPIIPRTAVIGLIGAVLGIERNDSYKSNHFLGSSKIAIQCLTNPKTIPFRTNLIQTHYITKIKKNLTIYLPNKLDRGLRSPQTEVLLVNPSYRIFISFDNDDKMEELKRRLEEKEYHFNPYFGRVNLFCYLKNIGMVKLRKCDSTDINLYSTIDSSEIEQINDGQFSIVYSVPMNYSFDEKKQKLDISKTANLLYFTSKISIHTKTNNSEIYTVVDAPNEIADLKENQIYFLPN